jgi:histidinol-phosphate aminotransferase
MTISRRELLLSFVVAGATASAASIAPLRYKRALGIEDVELASSPARPIRLDHNENAFGPSPRVVAALNEDLSINRYPKAEIDSLTDQLAYFHRARREQIVIGCGSTAILRACAALFLGPGKTLVMAEPSFEPMAQYARVARSAVVTVPLTRLYYHDLPATRTRISEKTGLVYICNPNNPTGTVTARKEIEEFLNGLPPTVWAIIDEAYHPYINPPSRETSFIDNPVSNPRVIVTRTFSNLYGLAGMRIGYAYTSPVTAEQIRARGLDAEPGVSALRAARIALEDQDYARRTIIENANARQEFFNQAVARRLQPMDSAANFVLLYIDGCLEVAEHFQRHGILVAADFPGLAQSIRVTLGRPEEMKEFWRVLDLKASLGPI